MVLANLALVQLFLRISLRNCKMFAKSPVLGRLAVIRLLILPPVYWSLYGIKLILIYKMQFLLTEMET